MSFVIYNTDTFRIFKFPHGGTAVFDEERVAKAQRTNAYRDWETEEGE